MKKGKAVTKEVIEDRQNLTEKWKEDVAAIPDGVYSPKKRLMPQVQEDAYLASALPHLWLPVIVHASG